MPNRQSMSLVMCFGGICICVSGLICTYKTKAMSKILEDRCVIHLLKGGHGDDGALHNSTQCVTMSIYHDCPQQYSFAHKVSDRPEKLQPTAKPCNHFWADQEIQAVYNPRIVKAVPPVSRLAINTLFVISQLFLFHLFAFSHQFLDTCQIRN